MREGRGDIISSQKRAKDFLSCIAIRNQLSLDEIPSKYELVGDVLMIPESALQASGWQREDLHIWAHLAACFGLKRVARKAKVDAGAMRQSRVVMLWPPGADTWVKVVENGISFNFDITRIMFCSGNCTERMRASRFPVAGETIVDLYCGIGYYTLPFLVYGNAAMVHACELNPDSVAALRRNLDEAKIEASRYTIHLGDNRESIGRLSDVADRVSLGLLPSSEEGWKLAVQALKTSGGMLHVHENVHEKLLTSGEWIDYCLRKFRDLFIAHEKNLVPKCLHIERVKSYAPRIYHIVADIQCVA